MPARLWRFGAVVLLALGAWSARCVERARIAAYASIDTELEPTASSRSVAAYPPELAALAELRRPATLDALAQRIEALAPRYVDPLGRARLAVWRARLAWSRGDTAAIEPLYRSALPVLLERARPEAVSASFALSFTLCEQLQRYDDARRLLDDIEPHALGYGERAELHYYQAIVAMRTARPALALSRLEELRMLGRRAVSEARDDAAARDKHERLLAFALQVQALVESGLGRHGRAVATLDHALAVARGQCAHVPLAINRALLVARAPDTGGDARSQVRVALLEARRLQRQHCANAGHSALLEHALADLSLREGRLDDARVHIAEARATGASADDRLAVAELELRGQIAAVEGRFRASLRHYDELVARLDYAGLLRADGELGRARALAALGRRADAIAALERADARVASYLRALPLDLGESFALEHANVAERLVEALLADGKPARALRHSRVARTRHFAALRWLASDTSLAEPSRARRERALAQYARRRADLARDRSRAWTIPLERIEAEQAARRAQLDSLHALLVRALPEDGFEAALAGPPEGTLLLAYFRRADGFDAFANDGRSVRHSFIADAELHAEAETSAWLAPFSAQIARARSLRIVGGEGGPLELAHALPFRGAPLVAALPIEYGLDLPVVLPERALSGNEPTRLFVIDPQLDLPSARAEAAQLRDRFRNARWLDGRAATHARFAREIMGASELHFAGHARIDEGAFYQSGLQLADAEVFTISDVLASPRVPERVVLLACDSARATEGAVASLGIAQAFIARGAREVVAAQDRVSDAGARAFSAAFYAASGSAAARVRSAQLALRAQGLPWQAYRTLVP